MLRVMAYCARQKESIRIEKYSSPCLYYLRVQSLMFVTGYGWVVSSFLSTLCYTLPVLPTSNVQKS